MLTCSGRLIESAQAVVAKAQIQDAKVTTWSWTTRLQYQVGHGDQVKTWSCVQVIGQHRMYL